jgi:predicted transcriptional regulator of viral defense system
MAHSRRTIDAELAKLAGEHNGLIRAFDLKGAGIARDVVTDRARLGILTSLQPHVWLFGQHTPTFEQQCQAAVWTSDGTLGARSALVWHDLVPHPPETLRPTVVVERTKRPIVRDATIIRSASFSVGDLCTRRGLSVTSIPRTLLDSASELTTDELERALDDALIAGKTTITEVKQRLDKAIYRSNVRSLRALVDERIPKSRSKGWAANESGGAIRIGHSRITRSPAEQGIKKLVLSLDVPAPQFNYRISTLDGGTLELDLAWPEYRVGFDIDGYRWHGGRKYWKRDIQRDHQITLSGWNVKRIIPEISAADLLSLIKVLLRFT